jgi:hypothetical protein
MSDLPPDAPAPRRRDLLRALALGGLAAAPALADEPANTKPDEPKPPTEADARMALIVARFGAHLDEAARKAVRAEVAAQVRRAESLRKLPLDNGTGPYPVFVPYRAPLS